MGSAYGRSRCGGKLLVAIRQPRFEIGPPNEHHARPDLLVLRPLPLANEPGKVDAMQARHGRRLGRTEEFVGCFFDRAFGHGGTLTESYGSALPRMRKAMPYGGSGYPVWAPC